MSKKTIKTKVSVDTIAKELKDNPQWVLWKQVDDGKKIKKLPINRWGKVVNSTDSKNWMDFPTALEIQSKHHPEKGLGYVLNGDFVAIDLDNCICEGVIETWAMDIISHFQSYTEVSASGQGIHIFLKGSLPESGKRNGKVECYSSKRYIAITGDVWQEFRIIKDDQARLNKWYLNTFSVTPPVTINPVIITPYTTSLSDDEIIGKMFSSKRGEQIEAIFHGVISACGDDASKADFRLCWHIAFYTQDVHQIDSIFRKSDLFRPKWDKKRGRKTYGQLTIERALENQTNFYKGKTNNGESN